MPCSPRSDFSIAHVGEPNGAGGFFGVVYSPLQNLGTPYGYNMWYGIDWKPGLTTSHDHRPPG